jgi:hypothetical protein
MNAQFVKLMMMTTSSHDNEALTALRKANAMLASANLNWEEYLGGPREYRSAQNPPWDEDKVQPPRQQRRHERANSDENIDRMFEEAFARVRPGSSFRQTIESIHTWWEEKGFLTQKQLDVIQRAATGR